MAVTAITSHFTREEFDCRDGTTYPAEWITPRLVPLCETLEAIREASGGSLVVDSGFRTLAYDQKLYDASTKDGSVAPPTSSQHPQGRAADIVSSALTPKALFSLILHLFIEGKLPHLGGVGLYPTFVHVDIRPRPASNHLAIWGGDRPSNIA